MTFIKQVSREVAMTSTTTIYKIRLDKDYTIKIVKTVKINNLFPMEDENDWQALSHTDHQTLNDWYLGGEEDEDREEGLNDFVDKLK